MISTKQRAYLRGLANKIEVVLQIGKNGIDDNVVKQANEALAAREIIKGSVLENSDYSARDAVQALSELCNADIVQTIGRRFVLYKPAKKPIIVLPD